MTQGTHNYVADDRNASVVIDINGDHFPRPDAKISVFDSGFMLGDGVWEGIRLHHGRLAFLDRHLDDRVHVVGRVEADPDSIEVHEAALRELAERAAGCAVVGEKKTGASSRGGG